MPVVTSRPPRQDGPGRLRKLLRGGLLGRRSRSLRVVSGLLSLTLGASHGAAHAQEQPSWPALAGILKATEEKVQGYSWRVTLVEGTSDAQPAGPLTLLSTVSPPRMDARVRVDLTDERLWMEYEAVRPVADADNSLRYAGERGARGFDGDVFAGWYRSGSTTAIPASDDASHYGEGLIQSSPPELSDLHSFNRSVLGLYFQPPAAFTQRDSMYADSLVAFIESIVNRGDAISVTAISPDAWECECIAHRPTGERPITMRAVVDVKHGWVKEQEFLKRAAEGRPDFPLAKVHLTLDKAQGRTIVREAVLIQTNTRDLRTLRWTFEDVSVNPTFAASDFQVVFPPHVAVIDHVAKQFYRTHEGPFNEQQRMRDYVARNTVGGEITREITDLGAAPSFLGWNVILWSNVILVCAVAASAWWLRGRRVTPALLLALSASSGSVPGSAAEPRLPIAAPSGGVASTSTYVQAGERMSCGQTVALFLAEVSGREYDVELLLASMNETDPRGVQMDRLLQTIAGIGCRTAVESHLSYSRVQELAMDGHWIVFAISGESGVNHYVVAGRDRRGECVVFDYPSKPYALSALTTGTASIVEQVGIVVSTTDSSPRRMRDLVSWQVSRGESRGDVESEDFVVSLTANEGTTTVFKAVASCGCTSVTPSIGVVAEGETDIRVSLPRTDTEKSSQYLLIRFLDGSTSSIALGVSD